MRMRTIFNPIRVTQNLRFLLGNYQYDRLPSPTCIRLLEFTPSSDKRIISCSLKTFELQYAPPFEALSYTWGNPCLPVNRVDLKNRREQQNEIDVESLKKRSKLIEYARDLERSGQTRRHSIICDGRAMKVTSNLRDALRMLLSCQSRRKDKVMPRYVWIDALCMNQEDVSERNSQVAKMASIFKASERVLIWLGKDDEYTADALTTIERIAQLPEEKWSSIDYTSFYQDPLKSTAQPEKLLNLTYHNWLGLIAFLNRPWFARSWVVQELAYAKAPLIVCGSSTIPWEKLSKTLSFIRNTKWYHHLSTEKLKHVAALQKRPGSYKNILQAKMEVGVGPIYLDRTRLKITSGRLNSQERNGKPPLRLLLDTHRFSKSTDPRDKIYAFLGLADKRMAPFNRGNSNILTPNYSLSVQDVYTQTARALTVSYGNLSLLSHVQDASLTQISDLPSWVPDYSVKLDPYPLRYRGPCSWNACGGLRWKVTSTMDKGLLGVSGYRLDKIDQIAILRNEAVDPLASWASIVKLALSLDQRYPRTTNVTPPSRVEALWRTLTTNTYAKQYPAPDKTGSLFIDYILNLQIRHRLMPWSSADEFQPHHNPISENIHPEWNTLLSLEPEDSSYSLHVYKTRLASLVENMFDGIYSPISLAQLQHEFDMSGGRKRRLFNTEQKFLGTGPRSLKEDDEVWILAGGSVPFVLRRLPNGNYKLVGEAYVYGVMHGEVLNMGRRLQPIVLE